MMTSPLRAVALMVLLVAVGRAEAQTTITSCAPNFDAAPGTLTGVVNTYYPGTATAAAGTTGLRVGAARAGGGAALAVGDMALVIQMQDAAINSTNTSAYGSGGTSGSGSTSLNGAGYYEFVEVTRVRGGGTNLTITGVGAGGGLVRTYTDAAATGTQGQRRFQVIRVPRYNTGVTLGAALTASAWDGATGGVLAVDVGGTLNLNGQTASVNGLGFRGAAGLRLTGTGAAANTDYVRATTSVTPGTAGAEGSKGEGIAGTPRIVYTGAAALLDTGTDGYPNGSLGRGAPGNAGGGGTDANPANNNQNSGGGGGGNCGAGGQGGFNWTPTIGTPASVLDVGGRGGATFPGSGFRAVMGGGAGAGTSNNGTADATASGINSSGVAGGGIVLLRVGGLSGTGTITANGAANGLNVDNDGSGGGGAGGTIIVTGPAGAALPGLTLAANGGKGGTNTGAGFPHGPGGGGGAGFILTSGAVASATATGGANGTTVNSAYGTAYGATAGGGGACVQAIVPHDVPGFRSAADCVAGATAVELRRFTAAVQRDGVLLRWQTGYETRNLGFNLYREERGQRVLVTPELVAGAALTEHATLRAGYSYAWRDPDGRPGARYWLEDVDLSGQRASHGPAVAEGSPLLALMAAPARFEPAATPRTALLSSVGAPRAAAPTAASNAARQDETLAFFSHQQLLTQRALAAGAAVKLSIREQGWYRVTYEELAATGFDVRRVDPRRLQLFAAGRERPLLVRSASGGHFRPGDSLEFYGTGIDLPSTGDNVYWLAEGARPGLRLRRELSDARAGQVETFLFTAERRDRTLYFPALRNGDGEKFFGGIIGSRVVSQPLVLARLAPDTGAPAVLEVALQGATVAPHRVTVQLNGADVGTVESDGQVKQVARFDVPQALLVEGGNTVSFARTGGLTDVSLVDTVRLSYWRRSTADAGELRLTARAGAPTRVDGFDRADIRVVDITDPSSPAELLGPVRADRGTFSISVKPGGLGWRTLLAFTSDRVKRPAALWLNAPSAWHRAANAADLVIVAHRDLLPQVGPLAALRRSQGYRVAVVDVEDVYDEFSFGLALPQALKDFFAHASAAWRVAPRFALLVGDASADARGYLGGGAYNLVPTKLFDTDAFEAASDDWLVDFDGDDLPELAIGRLPARTADEAALMVAKLVAYDAQPSSQRPALLVSDTGEQEAFEQSTANVRALLPWSVPVDEVLRSQLDDATARRRVLDGIDAGPLLVNFSGHGSVDLWRADLLTTEDAPGLSNGSRLPVFVLMTCLNGAFHLAELDSLAESLLKAPNGGAVAVWASSAVTQPFDQHAMNAELYRRLFSGRKMTLGEAVAQAKAAARGDVRRSWVLFGDPTLRLR